MASESPSTRTTAGNRPLRLNRQEREFVRMVDIAIPTIVMSVGVSAAWVIVQALLWTGSLSAWVGVPVAALLAYWSFTPMHDASHRAVGTSQPLNTFIGWLSGVPLLAPFSAFRHVHLEHHRCTNEGTDDPDHWSGRGAWFLLPLRWMTQDFYYYAWYFRRRGDRPRTEVLLSVSGIALYYGLVVLAVALGHGLEALLFVLIPSRLAIMWLAFSFDFIVHHPHDIPASADRYQATAAWDHSELTVPLVSQNYHLLHHLYPGVPFYRYSRAWRMLRPHLVKRNAKIRRLWSRSETLEG